METSRVRLLRPTCPILLLLILINFSTSEETCPTEFEGVAGGTVTFCFNVDWSKLEFLYLQRRLHGTEEFVNGFHASKHLPPTWPNTKMENSKLIMSELNISHNGEYGCYYRYQGSTDLKDYQLQLTVTAPFSKPSVTKTCGEKDGVLVGCYVKCVSHNGYPSQTITWQTSSTMWDHVNNSEEQCPTTQMFNISSTFYTNCSAEEVNVSCSVGNDISNTISLCGSRAGPPSYNNIIMVAVVTVLAVVISGVVYWRCKRRKKAKERGAAVKNGEANGNTVEEIPLKVGIEEHEDQTVIKITA